MRNHEAIFDVFVNLGIDGDVEMGVTVSVHGVWISGDLTSRDRYVDAVVATLRNGNEVAIGAAEGIAANSEELAADGVKIAPDDALLYLINASTFFPGTATPLTVGPIVVRVDSVDSFFLGKAEVA